MNIESHREVVEQWPVMAEFARLIDVKYLTVSKWKTRNFIPPQYWPRLVSMAHDMDLPITFRLLAELEAKKKGEPV